MRIPRDLDGLELVKLLGKYGFRMTRQTGSHIRLTSDTKGVYHLTIPRHKPLKLGTLNNILRDVGEDWRAGRVYLPQDELARFGVTESSIAAGCVDDRWRAFMRFQIERTRRLYDEALPGIALLEPDGRFAIAAAAQLYEAILEDIETYNGDVFSRRSYVSWWGKMRRLPGIWRQARRAGRTTIPERP